MKSENIRKLPTYEMYQLANKKIINDMNYIRDFKPADYNREHQIARDFLDRALYESPLPCVVITHHLPITELIHPKFLVGEDSWDLNQWFAARLESLVERHSDKIKAWFYGHTHEYSIQQHSTVGQFKWWYIHNYTTCFSSIGKRSCNC
mgnify:CR=1 FL=1